MSGFDDCIREPWSNVHLSQGSKLTLANSQNVNGFWKLQKKVSSSKYFRVNISSLELWGERKRSGRILWRNWRKYAHIENHLREGRKGFDAWAIDQWFYIEPMCSLPTYSRFLRASWQKWTNFTLPFKLTNTSVLLIHYFSRQRENECIKE